VMNAVNECFDRLVNKFVHCISVIRLLYLLGRLYVVTGGLIKC